jgi:hypothetical protein
VEPLPEVLVRGLPTQRRDLGNVAEAAPIAAYAADSVAIASTGAAAAAMPADTGAAAVGPWFGFAPDEAALLRVEKMRFPSKDRKDAIIVNQAITVEHIPAKAFEYVVNGKSAIEWVMERYQTKTDKDSGLANDPNLYAKETSQPTYILDLLLSVIAVSVRTVDIVAALPKPKW